ncbi:MAG: PEP-CTERM sorting domain-containing protein [Methylomonas sp.]|nr:MAG: PEP-CTERM sorting domain-containing protein [Methylomonas sp.]
MSINLQLTAVAGLLAVSGISQAALTTTTGPVSFSGSATVSASGTSVLSKTNSNNNASIANVSLGQFNAANGVLTGVDLQLTSNRQQTIDGYGYKNNGPGRDASGSGSSTAAMAAIGAAANFATAITQTGGACSLAHGPTGFTDCSWGPNASTANATNATASVADANLDDYVGNGSVSASLTLPTLSATTTLSRTQGQTSGSTTNYLLEWAGDLQANYSYLLHAAASFDGSSVSNVLTLDFGSITQNSAASLNFGLFNLADANRIGLDLDSVNGSGDTGAFSTDLSLFSGLAQGGSQFFIANLLTANTGTFSAQYLLNLSDEDLGASSTRQNYQLTLNLTGNVVAATAPVPVPGAVWLFGSAMLSMLGVSRRKQLA